ncbi:MAG: amino acid racemase [Candidatus Levybacteria bacterium]|nr:amino acid racemase [Candidatus Levybacteria bacterium]
MKTAGIIGGFGPEATAKIQLEIVDIFRAKKIKTRPPLLIWQTPIPLVIEEGLILRGKGVSKFLPFLIEGAQRLKDGGADFLIIPCNTLHAIMEKVEKKTDLPFINLLDETAKELKGKGVSKVGIIASSATIKSQLHQECLKNHDIQAVVPENKEQIQIDKAINQILGQKNPSKTKKILQSVVRSFQNKGIENILLACTDLQEVFPKNIKIHDTLQILAKATAREILREERQNN